MLPHNLLPIRKPLKDNSEVNPVRFYQNVVQHLIPDIIRIQLNGIPINLDKVRELEQELDNVLDTIDTRLENNPIIQKFLDETCGKDYRDKLKEIKSSEKTPDDFLKPFDPRNKIHRSYVINTYLESIGKDNFTLPEWTVRDLKRLLQVMSTRFLEDLSLGNIEIYMKDVIDQAMMKLARDKADIYNKNSTSKKLDTVSRKLGEVRFNPGSSTQKRELFSMLGIESESTTDAGKPKWNRTELERLQKMLASMLEEKENMNDKR